jgi:putative hydrolase of the HAD superfamily
MNLSQIEVIAFDADDTLWMNEPYFRESEEKFASLLSNWMPEHDVIRALFAVEMRNLPILGYGVKAFIVSMIEAAIEISGGRASAELIQKIIQIGKDQLEREVVILDGVKEVLEGLSGKYRLVVATKGDLKEQEGKLHKSGLEKYFHHIEIVTEKTPKEYTKLIQHLDILPSNFLMIGNSLKSDILPVLDTGAFAFHIPYHTTWEHEKVDEDVVHPKFTSLDKMTDLLSYLH